MSSLGLVLVLALMQTPPPDAASPLKVITTVKASNLCTVLRKNVASAVGGLIANNTLVDQGGWLVRKTRRDTFADPKDAGATGGAGASSQLDDVRLGQVVSALAKNIERIDALLDDPAAFPKNRPLDDRLKRVRARLQDVLDRQRVELNVLAGNVDTNMATDLQSRHDPVTQTKLVTARTQRVSFVEALDGAVHSEQTAETLVASEVSVLVRACR